MAKHKTPPRDPRTGAFRKRKGAKRKPGKRAKSRRRKNAVIPAAGLNPKRKGGRRPGSHAKKGGRKPGSKHRRRNPAGNGTRAGIFGFNRLASFPGVGWMFRSANFWTALGAANGATFLPMARRAIYVKGFKLPARAWYNGVNEKGAPTWRRTLADAGGEIVLATPAAIVAGMVRSPRMAGLAHFARGNAIGGYGHGLGLLLSRSVYGMLPSWLRPAAPTDVLSAADVAAATAPKAPAAASGASGYRNRLNDYLQQGDAGRIKDYLQQGDAGRIRDYMQQGDRVTTERHMGGYAPRQGALMGRMGQGSEGPVQILTASQAVGEGDVNAAIENAIATAVEQGSRGALGIDGELLQDEKEDRTF